MGLITKIYSWVDWQPNSKGTTLDWFAGLILILLASFLWSTVVRQTIE